MVRLNFEVSSLRGDGHNEPDTPLEVVVRYVDYLVERLGLDRVGFGLRRRDYATSDRRRLRLAQPALCARRAWLRRVVAEETRPRELAEGALQDLGRLTASSICVSQQAARTGTATRFSLTAALGRSFSRRFDLTLGPGNRQNTPKIGYENHGSRNPTSAILFLTSMKIRLVHFAFLTSDKVLLSAPLEAPGRQNCLSGLFVLTILGDREEG